MIADLIPEPLGSMSEEDRQAIASASTSSKREREPSLRKRCEAASWARRPSATPGSQRQAPWLHTATDTGSHRTCQSAGERRVTRNARRALACLRAALEAVRFASAEYPDARSATLGVEAISMP